MNQMKNVKMVVEGTVLTLTIDLAQRNGKSASGKSEVVASTLGNKAIPGFENIFLGVNCYTK
jgi:hypothetical protein